MSFSCVAILSSVAEETDSLKHPARARTHPRCKCHWNPTDSTDSTPSNRADGFTKVFSTLTCWACLSSGSVAWNKYQAYDWARVSRTFFVLELKIKLPECDNWSLPRNNFSSAHVFVGRDASHCEESACISMHQGPTDGTFIVLISTLELWLLICVSTRCKGTCFNFRNLQQIWSWTDWIPVLGPNLKLNRLDPGVWTHSLTGCSLSSEGNVISPVGNAQIISRCCRNWVAWLGFRWKCLFFNLPRPMQPSGRGGSWFLFTLLQLRVRSMDQNAIRRFEIKTTVNKYTTSSNFNSRTLATDMCLKALQRHLF